VSTVRDMKVPDQDSQSAPCLPGIGLCKRSPRT